MKRTILCFLLLSGCCLVEVGAQVIAVRAGHLVDPATGTVKDQNIQILKKVNFVMKDGKVIRKPD